MSFKGDLSTIGLAEIFQMISLSRREGTLRVEDGESRKCIFFGPGGVQLISTGRRKGLKLGELLIRAGKITETRLEKVIQAQTQSGLLLGEALVRSGAVTDRDIQEVVRTQIEEEIYDLFLWKRAAFEFVEGPPPYELQDPQAHATKLSFDVNGLLLEALRRVDEWKLINEKIPSIDCVIAFSHPNGNQRSGPSSDNGVIRRLSSEVDGVSTLGEIIERAGASRFEACRAVVDLLNRGDLRILLPGELVDLAERWIEEGKPERGIVFYRAAMSMAPDDVELARRFATAVERIAGNTEASSAYVRVGQTLQRGSRVEEAQNAYRRALRLDPESRRAKEEVFRREATLGDVDAAAGLGQELLSDALEKEDYDRASILCEQILRMDPSNVEARFALATGYRRTGRTGECEEQLRLIRQALPEDPGDRARVLERLEAFRPRPSQRPAARARKRRRPPLRWIVPIGSAVVLLGSYGVFEWRAHGEFRDRAGEAEACVKKRDFAGAKRVLERFRSSFLGRSPFLAGPIRNRLETIAALEGRESPSGISEKTFERRMAECEEAVETVRSRFREGRYGRAQKDLVDLLALLQKTREDPYVRREAAAGVRLGKIAGAVDSLRKEVLGALDQVRTRMHEADKARAAGRYRDAVLLYEGLFRGHPHFVRRADVEFPLLVRARPDGTSVAADGKTLGVVRGGKLLITLRYKEARKLTFARAGYRSPADLLVKYADGETKEVVLDEKTALSPDWPWKPFETELTREPVYGGGFVFVGAGRGVYTFPARRAVLWDWPPAHPELISGDLVSFGGRIFFGCAGRRLHVLDPAQRKEWVFPLGAAPAGSPGVSADGRYVAIGTADRYLAYLDLRGRPAREILWRVRLPSPPEGRPLILGGTILVLGQDHVLRAVTREKELWTYGTGMRLTSPVSFGDRIYVGRQDGGVVGLTKEGKIVWSGRVPGEIWARPTVAGDGVYVATGKGTVHRLSHQTGKGELILRADVPIRTEVALAPSLVLVSAGSRLYALGRITGERRWSFSAGGAIRFTTSPLVVGDVAYVGTDDKSLYAVELD